MVNSKAVQLELQPLTPFPLSNRTFLAREYHSGGELTKLLILATGYKLLGFQTQKGICKGHIVSAQVSPISRVMLHSTSLPLLISGKRNPDVVIFAAAPPANPRGRLDVPYFWKNQAMTWDFLVGGFGLNETQCHYMMSPNHIQATLIVDRKCLLHALDNEENRSVYEYMCGANSVQMPAQLWFRFVNYICLGCFNPELASKLSCPLLSILNLLKDGSYQHAMPSRKLRQSSERVLDQLEVVLNHIHKCECNVECLGAILSLGRTQLNTAFSELFHCTPMQFLRYIRLERAMLLLRSPSERAIAGLYSIEDIAGNVGFGSVSTFRKNFNDWFCTAPKTVWVDT